MNCDPIARYYRWLEYAGFGKALERRRAAFVGCVSGARKILALGDGDGRGLEALLRANPLAEADTVDCSSRMLQLARARTGSGRVRYHHANILEQPLPGSNYDLIVTHFFLDCFEEADLERVADLAVQAAHPGSRWIISEFRRQGLVVSILYWFFGIVTGLQTRRLADYHPALERRGFSLMRSEAAWGGLLVSELWELGEHRVY